MSERTIEILKLAELITNSGLFKTIIDVGCFNSVRYWQPILERYYHGEKPVLEGIDRQLCPDEEISGLFYRVHKKDVNEFSGFYPELVTCISTIEHNNYENRLTLIETLCRLSSHHIYLTFPSGIDYTNIYDNYSIIGNEEFRTYLEIFKKYYFDYQYRQYYCETPNGLDQIWWPTYDFWPKHDPTKGVQAVTIINVYKEHTRIS